MPIFLITTIFFAITTGLFIFLFIKHRQRADKFELTCYMQKFDSFKEKSKGVKSILGGVQLIKQYTDAVSTQFAKNHSIQSAITSSLVKKIKSSNDLSDLHSIIGDIFDRDDTCCELRLWRNFKFEVLPYLHSLYDQNKSNNWLKKLIL